MLLAKPFELPLLRHLTLSTSHRSNFYRAFDKCNLEYLEFGYNAHLTDQGATSFARAHRSTLKEIIINPHSTLTRNMSQSMFWLCVNRRIFFWRMHPDTHLRKVVKTKFEPKVFGELDGESDEGSKSDYRVWTDDEVEEESDDEEESEEEESEEEDEEESEEESELSYTWSPGSSCSLFGGYATDQLSPDEEETEDEGIDSDQSERGIEA